VTSEDGVGIGLPFMNTIERATPPFGSEYEITEPNTGQSEEGITENTLVRNNTGSELSDELKRAVKK
jgi:hypothetical protein